MAAGWCLVANARMIAALRIGVGPASWGRTAAVHTIQCRRPIFTNIPGAPWRILGSPLGQDGIVPPCSATFAFLGAPRSAGTDILKGRRLPIELDADSGGLFCVGMPRTRI